MNSNVITHILLWYLVFSGSGIFFWLCFNNIFQKLGDKGYAISKIIPMLSITLILWILGFVFKVPINFISCMTILLLFLTFCIFYKIKFKVEIPKTKKSLIVITELIFLLMLGVGLFITSIHPSIDNTTERMMDFNLLNTLTTKDNLPAVDTWFTPKNVNYYYYGHYFFSVINKITFTDPYMGYLLAMGFIYGLAGVLFFSLGYSLKKSYSVGLLSMCFALFFSNFSFIYNLGSKFFQTLNSDQIIEFVIFSFDITAILAIIFSLFFIQRKKTKLFLLICIPTIILHLFLTKSYDIANMAYQFMLDPTKANLWYPDVSRVIDSTINEFPFYSIVIGDLHPHFLDTMILPALLMLFYVDYRLIYVKRFLRFSKKFANDYRLNKKGIIKKYLKNRGVLEILILKIFTLILFSTILVTNSWELICIAIFVFIKDLIYLTRCIYKVLKHNTLSEFKKLIFIVLIPVVLDIFVIAGGYISQLPYFGSVDTPVHGIRLNLINNSTDFFSYFKLNYSLLPNFSLKYGLDTIFFIALFIYILCFTTYLLYKRKILVIHFLLFNLSIIGIVLVVGTFTATLVSYVQTNFDISPFQQFFNVWIVYFLMSVIGLFILFRKLLKKGLSNTDYFILTLFLSAIVLVIFTEYFYVAEYFARAVYQHHRANTVFKVNYISQMFFSICAAWTIYKLFKSINWQKNFKSSIQNYFSSSILSFIRIFVVIVIWGVFLYVPYTVDQWINYFPADQRFSLDGYAMTKKKFPDIMGGVDYLDKVKNNQDILLEANGDAYKMESEGTTLASIPTVLGWWGHEAQWRETADPNVIDNLLNQRVTDIASMYNLSGDWKGLMKHYGITYIWIGDNEKTKFNQEIDFKFDNVQCISEVYQNNTIKIYRVDQKCLSISKT